MMACLESGHDLRAGHQGVLERGAVSGATSWVFGVVFASHVKSLETGHSILSREHIASHCITGIVLGFSMFRYPIYSILPVCHLLECEHGCYNCNASAAFLLNHQGWMIAWENWRPARNQPSFAQLLNSLEPGTNRATAASSIF